MSIKIGWNRVCLFAVGALVAFVCAASTAFAAASPPEYMAHQGFLVDGNGDALGLDSPVNYRIIFRIYDAQSGGNLLWSEQQTVTVDKGYFSVLFGEGANVDSEARPALSTLFTNSTASDRYVATTIKGIGSGGSDVDILPRGRLMSAPYAFMANKVVANSITTVDIADGSITSNKLAPNAIPTTLATNSSVRIANLVVGTGSATGLYTFAQGSLCVASGDYSHAEGNQCTASGWSAHAEGEATMASGRAGHAEGMNNTNTGNYGCHVEGFANRVTGTYGAHAEGHMTLASGDISHAEGGQTAALGYVSHAEGYQTTNTGNYGSHAEGYRTLVTGGYGAHAEGNICTASGTYGAHAEGNQCIASGDYSHAEGLGSIASGWASHAEGDHTTASGGYGSHASGSYTVASAGNSHAAGSRARALHDRSYVWCGDPYPSATFDSTAGDQFSVYARNGIRLLGGTVYTQNGTVSSASDRRLKQNIALITNALDKVEQINGVYYEMIAKPGKTEVGVIAQDVEKVLPEVVGESDGYKCVDYGKLTALLIEAVKELKAEVQVLKQQVGTSGQ